MAPSTLGRPAGASGASGSARAAGPAPVAGFAVSHGDRALLERLAAVAATGRRPGSRRAPRSGEAWWVRGAIAVAAPGWLPIVVLAALVRLGRGRLPVLVLQERAGLGRRPVLVPKIATMSLPTNRRALAGLVELSRDAGDDPDDLAPIDRWLRRTGVDELPQLALVVAGRMRLVGPRPATYGELEQMVDNAARDPACAVGVDDLAPGLIGVWQILDRHRYSLAGRQACDRFMIDHWSPALQREIVRVAARQALRRLAGRS